METVFGAFEVGQGYVIVPRATHRWIPLEGDDPLRVYCIEANSHIAPPKRYLSRYGQFLEHSPYCERDLGSPPVHCSLKRSARSRTRRPRC